MFLKRSKTDSVAAKDLFVGNSINVFARQLKIVDFADQSTRNALQPATQRTFAMVKPDCFDKAGAIISRIEAAGLSVISLKTHRMTVSEAQEFYGEHRGKPFFEGLVQFISSGSVLGLELMGKNAVSAWRELLGPTSPAVARTDSPGSLRAKFGTEGVRNCAHGSDSPASAERETHFFFSKLPKQTLVHPNVTCLVIKPHLLKERRLGEALEAVAEGCKERGLRVAAAQLSSLNKDEIEEFLEVYKGVLPEYGLLVEEFKSGPLVAVLAEGGPGAVEAGRQLCGPHDPQVAKTLRNGSLRARFGGDKVRNGFHCTDLESDGLLEGQFFFA